MIVRSENSIFFFLSVVRITHKFCGARVYNVAGVNK